MKEKPLLLLIIGSTLRCVVAINITSTFDAIQRFWSGAAYGEDRTKALYLMKPLAGFQDSDCAPATGYPSQCPIELMSMTLNQPAKIGDKSGNFSFNVSFFGDVLISSPNSSGYYALPDKCLYERSHVVEAVFNDSKKSFTFEIKSTISDYTYCSYPSFSSTTKSLLPGQRCVGGNCYPQLYGKKIDGIFQLSTTSDDNLQLDLTLAFPYQVYGPGSWSDFKFSSGTQTFAPTLVTTAEVLSMGTVLANNVVMYTLTSPAPWRPIAWFADRRPQILRIEPSFGPEEGGSIITIHGTQFATETLAQRQRRILLSHDGGGGVQRECCSTSTVSENMMTCRLPRVSCISSNPTNPCPQPGQFFVNQTVSIGIQPNVKGFDPAFDRTKLDDFVQFEGDWEVVDEDVYGGLYVPASNVIGGEIQILKTPRSQAVASTSSCCPICQAPGDPSCKLNIKQSVSALGVAQQGIYTVTIPSLMKPGGPGVCDAATNFVNTSLNMGIERSTDVAGFTPAVPLSITSCIDQSGSCRSLSRVSIRVTCNQLVWSTGSIVSFLPSGQTVETYQWHSDSVCDRRMQCVGGACMWTRLTNTSAADQPKMQRRVSSAQIGLQVAWMNPSLSTPSQLSTFISGIAALVYPVPADPYRVQLLQLAQQSDVSLSQLGSTFAVRRSTAALCEPDPGYATCTMFAFIIYLMCDGPGTLGSEQTAQAALEEMASSPYGSPRLRELNIYKACFDRSNIPADNVRNILYSCFKVQYPGILQIDAAQTPGGSLESDLVKVRVAKVVWNFAKVAVTRTGGSDLGCTVDYRTVAYNGSGFAAGSGVDFTSKMGQLRWVEGDTRTKYITVPIRDDGITSPDQTFEIWVYNVINASMLSNDTQRAVITIVGINNWPDPRFIDVTLQTIGAVCGAATAVPCALFLARLIRSVRRDISRAARNSEKPDERKAKSGKGGGVFSWGKGGKDGKPKGLKAIAS